MATIIEQLRDYINLELKDLGYDTNDNSECTWDTGKIAAYEEMLEFLDTLSNKQQEISLEEFTEKIDDWKARFTRPDDIPVKATIAFTGRMFYMYPNVARQWYENLPKATQD